jgi:hypothetical protein
MPRGQADAEGRGRLSQAIAERKITIVRAAEFG